MDNTNPIKYDVTKVTYRYRETFYVIELGQYVHLTLESKVQGNHAIRYTVMYETDQNINAAL